MYNPSELLRVVTLLVIIGGVLIALRDPPFFPVFGCLSLLFAIITLRNYLRERN